MYKIYIYYKYTYTSQNTWIPSTSGEFVDYRLNKY
jgi:hypothetical protein